MQSGNVFQFSKRFAMFAVSASRRCSGQQPAAQLFSLAKHCRGPTAKGLTVEQELITAPSDSAKKYSKPSNYLETLTNGIANLPLQQSLGDGL